MSDFADASAIANTSRPASLPAQPPHPLVAPTGSPGLNSVLDVVNRTVQPFQDAPPAEQGVAGAVAQGLGGVMGVVGAPAMIIDTAFAALTAPIAAMFPSMPAVTLLGMHVGVPHAHTHPPSLIPPAPPVPLPSIGMLVGSGAVTVLIGGMPAARAGDIGISVTCGSLAPPFEVFTGSSNVFIGGARAARVLDITKHCNPTSMGPFAIAMGAAGVVAGAAGAMAANNIFAAAQAAADAAVLAVKLLCGKDPGIPPGMGTLVGPPVPNVLIGGFPCPPVGQMAVGAILKALGKMAKALKGGSSEENGQCANGSHPIYLVTGENFDSFKDFISGGLFEWRRHYTTARFRNDSPLGHGWRHFYQRSLRVRLHKAMFMDWNGLRIDFPRFERGSDTTRANGRVLRRLDRGHYRLSYRGQPDLDFVGGEFDGDLRLVKVSNKERELELSYDGLGRLAAAVESSRKTREQRRFEFRYDERNHLVQLLEFPIAEPGAWAQPEPTLRAAYVYADTSDLIQARDALGGDWFYDYDPFHRWTKQTDPRGYSYSFKYDASGRCVEASGKDGLWWAQIEYFPEKGCTKYTEGDGATWEFHYDGDGVVTKIVDPYGGEKLRERDAEGRMAREIDSGGRVVRWLYDADGAHSFRVDRFGNFFPPEAEMAKLPDPRRRRLPRTSLEWHMGDAVKPSPLAMLGADPSGLALVPAELEMQASLCFRRRPPEQNPWDPAPDLRPKIQHDVLGRKSREVNALGHSRQWQHDATGNLVMMQDRDARVFSRSTTSWNLVGNQRDPLGNTIKYQYSRLEQVVSVIDPLENVTKYDYDLKERLVRVHRHGRVRDEYVYDGGDHLVEKRDGNGTVLFKTEVHDNQLVAVRHLSSGGEHRYDYDERGRVIEASTQDDEIRLKYNGPGPPVADLRDGTGVEHWWDGRSWSTLFLGRFRLTRTPGQDQVELADPSDRKSAIRYDATGIVRRSCSNGTTEISQYDAEGRLEARIAFRKDRYGRLQSRSTAYAHTAEGDLHQIDDSIGGTTRYEYDAAHRLAAATLPRGERHEYRQDPANNVFSMPGLRGARFAKGNLLTGTDQETLEYNGRDHLAERRRNDGTCIRYTYDSFDMLVRVERTLADGSAEPSWETAYDSLGRRLWSRKGDVKREFFWDGDRLGAEVLPDGHLRVYQYAGRDALVPLGFIEYDDRSADPASSRSYHVFSNNVGMPLCIEDERGEIVWWANRVDPYGSVELRSSPAVEYNLRWPGHYFDPEIGLHYNRYRYYDPRLGRYLQSDPLGYGGSPVNLYAYCANPLKAVDILGLEHAGDTEGSPGSKENEGTEQAPKPNPEEEPPPKALKDMSHEELKAHVEERAAALKTAFAEADPEGEKSTTLSVGVLEKGGDPETRRVVVTTSDDSQKLPPSVVDAMEPGEKPMPAPPQIERGPRYDNPDYDPEGPKDARNNPKTMTDPVVVDPETGEKQPYEKAVNGEPVEGTQHHAEQRMENGAAQNGEDVAAQAPTKPCCPGCQQVLGDSGGLNNIPDSLQGK